MGEQKKIAIAFIFLEGLLCLYTQAFSQSDKALTAEKIIVLIPDKVSGFSITPDSKSKVIKVGTLEYSVAEKTFLAKRERSIKILLFDYKGAPIMYNQAIQSWSGYGTIESDSLLQRPVRMKDCTGWESHNIRKRNSQILLGIRNRFFLTVEGTGVELEFLWEVVQQFKFEIFPK